MSDYKPTGSCTLIRLDSPTALMKIVPTEHDGLRKDGKPDQRVGTGGKQSEQNKPARHLRELY
jgi:hypothetical protein